MDNKRKRSFLDDDSDKRIRKTAKMYTKTITEDTSDASSADGREPQALSCERPKIPRRGRADPVNVDISYGNSLGERTRIPPVVTGSDVYPSEEQSEFDVYPSEEHSESEVDPAEEQSEFDVDLSEEQSESDVDTSDEQSESDVDTSDEQSESHSDDRNDDAVGTEKLDRAQGSDKSSSEEEDEEDDECVELLRLTYKVDNKRKISFLEDDSNKRIRKIAKTCTMTIDLTEDTSDASSADGREPQALSCERPKIPRHGRAVSSDRDISSEHNQAVLPINGHPVNADMYSVNSLGEDRAQGSEKSSSEEEDEKDDECVELLCLTHKVRGKFVKRSSGYYPIHRSS